MVEPKEKRVPRAILRKGAQKARERGCTVINRAHAVEINGKTFNLENAHELDRTYKEVLLTPPEKKNLQERNTKSQSKQKLPCERQSEKWLAFYTESTYSSFHKVPVTYRNVTYKTLEHGYQATHALECNNLEASNVNSKADTVAEAKAIGGEIPFIEHRETVKGWHMEELQYTKYMRTTSSRKTL